MDVIKIIFNGKGTKNSSDHDTNSKTEKIPKTQHRKNAPGPTNIVIKTDIDKSGSFLKVEDLSDARRSRSQTDGGGSPSLARRIETERYMKNLELEMDCDSSSQDQQQSLQTNMQKKRSTSMRTRKEMTKNLNRLSYNEI